MSDDDIVIWYYMYQRNFWEFATLREEFEEMVQHGAPDRGLVLQVMERLELLRNRERIGFEMLVLGTRFDPRTDILYQIGSVDNNEDFMRLVRVLGERLQAASGIHDVDWTYENNGGHEGIGEMRHEEPLGDHDAGQGEERPLEEPPLEERPLVEPPLEEPPLDHDAGRPEESRDGRMVMEEEAPDDGTASHVSDLVETFVPSESSDEDIGQGSLETEYAESFYTAEPDMSVGSEQFRASNDVENSSSSANFENFFQNARTSTPPVEQVVDPEPSDALEWAIWATFEHRKNINFAPGAEDVQRFIERFRARFPERTIRYAPLDGFVVTHEQANFTPTIQLSLSDII